jgi:hypothetical protein
MRGVYLLLGMALASLTLLAVVVYLDRGNPLWAFMGTAAFILAAMLKAGERA